MQCIALGPAMPKSGENLRPSKGFCNLLLAVSLLGISATSWTQRCPTESFNLLRVIMHRLGNSIGDVMLYYTPQNINVCYVENLDCFVEELEVVQEEEEEHAEILSRLLLRLHQMKLKWQRENETKPSASGANPPNTCPPCHSHPERPVKDFLQKLQQLFQAQCRIVAQQRRTYDLVPVP